jgi:aminomethyltransferase
MTMDIKTPLYNLHIGLNARMISFAGYQMPVQYPPGIIKETLHCRTQAGLFDVSHMGQFELSLDSALELEKVCPSNISSLAMGQQRYTVLTNDQGGIIDDIIITRLPTRFLLTVNASCKHNDLSHLTLKLSAQCHLKHLTEQALLALQGPKSPEVIAELCPEAAQINFLSAIETTIDKLPCVISRSGYTGEDGFEISMANHHAEIIAKRLLSFETVMPMGLGTRDALRLEAGFSLYGHELTESISPVEAGLSWLIRPEGCYLGYEKISPQLQNGPPRKKVGLRIESKIPVRAGAEIMTANGNIIGHITSGSFSPSLNQPIALGLIDRDSQNDVFFADIRGRTIKLHRTQLPFVPHRYYKGP